jgi:hypothetical protein
MKKSWNSGFLVLLQGSRLKSTSPHTRLRIIPNNLCPAALLWISRRETKMTDSDLRPIVEQATSLLELVFDEAMRRAGERHALPGSLTPEMESLWVEGAEAVRIMGAGYTLGRLKHLGHQGVLVMDRKDPDKPNSPYIFLRASLHDYCAQRVFELEARKARQKKGKPWTPPH